MRAQRAEEIARELNNTNRWHTHGHGISMELMPGLSGVPHRRAVKAFEKADFWVAREGKHISMTDGE